MAEVHDKPLICAVCGILLAGEYVVRHDAPRCFKCAKLVAAPPEPKPAPWGFFWIGLLTILVITLLLLAALSRPELFIWIFEKR
jgi:hypothetical protein